MTQEMTTPVRIGMLRAKSPPASPPAPAAPAPDAGNLFNLLLAGIYDGVLITALDGTVLEVNPRAEEMLGLGRLQLCRMGIADVIAGVGAVLPKLLARMDAGQHTVLEAFCRRADGTTFPAEIAISLLKLTEQGEVCFALRNISHRHQAQEAQRTEHAILSNVACGIAMVDQGGKIAFVNPAFVRMRGLPPAEQIIGRPMRAVWDSKTVDAFESCLLKGHVWAGEIELQRPGWTRILQATAAPVRHADGGLQGLALSFLDVTTLKQAQEAIRQEADEQLRRARQQTEFGGRLSIVSLADVIQLIDNSRKTGTLDVLNDQNSLIARVSFQEGRVIRAVCGELEGEQAFCSMFILRGAEFRFRNECSVPPDPRLAGGTMGLLLEAVRRMDEDAAGQKM